MTSDRIWVSASVIVDEEDMGMVECEHHAGEIYIDFGSSLRVSFQNRAAFEEFAYRVAAFRESLPAHEEG